jgi:hypothetical protein
VVPLTLLVNEIPVEVPEQIVALVGVAVTSGDGLTVITIGGIVLVQPAGLVATTLYVTVPAVVPVAVRTSDILFPEPDDCPEAPVAVAVQLYVVPAIELDNATEVDVPEQIEAVAGVAVPTGLGLIVTETDIGAPGHEFAVGTML